MMTEAESQELASTMDRDQRAAAFQAAAEIVAVYYRTLTEGGIKRKDALDLTADMQSVYLCTMLGVEI
jgi:hypothetical protein